MDRGLKRDEMIQEDYEIYTENFNPEMDEIRPLDYYYPRG